MVFALFLLGLQDAIVKLTTVDVSIWQFQAVRATCNLSLLVGFIVLSAQLRHFRPKRAWAVALRSLALVGTMLCFFAGLPFLSLAEIAAGLYLFPLIITILSAFVLGEKVGPRRVAAVLCGFAGSLLILKPGGADFRFVSLLPVCAAFFYAAMILTTRKLCRDESPYTLALGVGIAFVLVGLCGLAIMPPPDQASEVALQWPYLLTGWHPLALTTFGLIVVCSLLNLTANISLARAYQSAESSWLAPYDYSYLIFATFWGYVFWRTVPDVFTFAGMALIAGSGIYVAWRERTLRVNEETAARNR